MGVIEVGLLVLTCATVMVVFAPRLHLPIEVVLLLGSLILSVLPGLPLITFKPDVVFLVFLPPILFAAAYFTSWRDFKANSRPIGLLAIGLVLFTTVSVAAAMRAVVPDLSWPAAFIFGAKV
jgi:monovalent cation/hydrogen antiporter